MQIIKYWSCLKIKTSKKIIEEYEANKSELTRLMDENKQLIERLNLEIEKNNQILNSKSWKVTAPLRKITSSLKKDKSE